LGFANQGYTGEYDMPSAPATSAQPADETAEAAEIVERFLVASMVPDPETAAQWMAADVAITFTGGRKFSHPRETTGFNAMRYKWVKKKMERTDVSPGTGETVVYNTGTLYGEWPDGTPFEGNRYVDRFVVRGGKIVQMDVWNDSAERLLIRHDIKA
jgi:ketosteroid isomerase-like protein